MWLAEEIERDFERGGQYDYEDYDPSSGRSTRQSANYFDGLCDADKEYALAEVASLVADLRSVSERARHLDYLLCSDHGPESYLRHIREIHAPHQEPSPSTEPQTDRQ